jgi:methionyl-tRNA formyltransferase
MSITRIGIRRRMKRSILFFGTHCDFADTVLSALVSEGHTIVARVVPGWSGARRPFEISAPRRSAGTGRFLPIAGKSGQSEAPASIGHYPTIAVNQHANSETASALSNLGAQISVVCCYPRKLPMALVNAATSGGINVHPSLLPAYRGPDPLFWVYRNGESETGVTIHLVEPTLDSGPILMQSRIEVPVGFPGDSLWRRSAETSARLLAHLLSTDQVSFDSGQKQGDGDSSYYSWPQEADLLIDPTEWEAWRVYHFCRGVIPLGFLPRLTEGNFIRPIVEAVRYDVGGEQEVDQQIDAHQTRWIRCRTGHVLLRFGSDVW